MLAYRAWSNNPGPGWTILPCSRRMPPPGRSAIHVDANEEWAAGLVLARKKDGSIRIACDMRQVNIRTSHCPAGNFPLARIEQVLPQCPGAKIFTAYDSATAFWQIPIATGSQPADHELPLRGTPVQLGMPSDGPTRLTIAPLQGRSVPHADRPLGPQPSLGPPPLDDLHPYRYQRASNLRTPSEDRSLHETTTPP